MNIIIIWIIATFCVGSIAGILGKRYGVVYPIALVSALVTMANIFANKITAVIGRDNPKDIFDIYLLDKFTDFDFQEIITVAHEKAGFSNDDLIIRLKTFPLFLLKSIVLKDLSFLDDFDKEYKQLIEYIEKEISKR